MRNRYLLALALFAVVLVPGWTGGSPEDDDHRDVIDTIPNVSPLVSADERLQLVATTNIIGDVLENVTGGEADIVVLIPVGQNPHSYEPTPSTLRTLESADIVFTNGLGLEEALLSELHAGTASHAVPVSVGISPLGYDDDHDDHHDHEEGDPHVWMDPNNIIVWVRNMVDVLSAADPSRAEGYRDRGAGYVDRLEELDREIRSRLAVIPEADRKLVLDHESFAYFAHEYGFETVGTIVPGTSDRAEPSAQDVARLVDLLRAENARAIFVGRTASRGLQRLAETVAAEVGQEIAIVPTLSGSLAPAGERGDTYVDLIRYNVEQILDGLSSDGS